MNRPTLALLALALFQHAIAFSVPQPVSASFNAVSHNLFGSGFTAWDDWGGDCRGQPVSLSRGEGVDIVVLSSDYTAWTRAKHSGITGLWLPLFSPTLQDSPAGVQMHSGDFNIMARGADNSVYWDTRILLTWQGFQNLKFETDTMPGVAAWSDNNMLAFARKPNGTMHMREFRNSFDYNDGRWTQLGDLQFASPPIGVSLRGKTDNAYVVALDASDNVRYTTFVKGSWSREWISLQQFSTSVPTVSFRANGFDVVIRGLYGNTLINSFDEQGGWTGWFDLGGESGDGVLGRPAIAASGSDAKFVFMVDGDNKMWFRSKRFGSDYWDDWTGYDGHWIQAATVNEREGKYVDVWSYDPDSRLRHTTLKF